MSDAELDAFVGTLPSELDFEPSAMPASDLEGLLRTYVILATHLIHRPLFSPRHELPPAIARPLWALSTLLKRPPSLTYASYVLANFTVAVRKRMPATELKIAQTPTGTDDETWFVAVHLSVETGGGDIVDALPAIENGLEKRDERALVSALGSIEASLVFATKVLPTIRERLSADVFVNVIRPLLYGHGQVHFRGVPGEPVMTYIGETGAQSGAIRAADALLGIPHSEAITTSLNKFLLYAPHRHQEFCARATHLGQRLASAAQSPGVRAARRSALRALADFRRIHFKVVTDYLVPSGKPAVSHGTGGTEFKVWLQRIIDETDEASTDT